MTRELYIGSISGTSLDGIDLALVEIDTLKTHNNCKVVDSICHPLPTQLKNTLSALCYPGDNEISDLGQADVWFGHEVAKGISQLLNSNQVSANDIAAIGSHGQTIRHEPNAEHPFSLQVGNGNIIAEQTGITTITDFRMADMAAGGQGAPLAPAFHEVMFQDQRQTRIALNLGGIANISVIPSIDSNNATSGYDIGPANGLMDRWIEQHNNRPYDEHGDWARSGTVIPRLLKTLLSEPYFAQATPKSTGRELFNLEWLGAHLTGKEDPADVQRTLLELTAVTCAEAINKISNRDIKTFLCGGGAHNAFLVERISGLAASTISTTDELDIPVDDVEACAFAWFAFQTNHRRTSNCPSVTGAHKKKILGAIYYP